MTSGFVDIGGLDMYYERHGRGAPLVLLHGAMGTIESCFSRLLSVLAEHFEVIAIELQGHGHTRDIDRPLTYKGMARDTVALLDALGIKRAHFAGYSMGGAVALQLAFDHSERVDHLVFAGGVSFETNGVYPELQAMFDAFDPHQVDGTSWHEAYRRVAPDPDAWTSLVLKVNELDRTGVSWPREQLKALEVPTLLVIGDADIVRPEHTVEMFRLLGGGLRLDTGRPSKAQLAILPGTTHEGLVDRVEWLSSMIVSFLSR
jgi:pimeloyl-ACP methyl ester carboxylesterase